MFKTSLPILISGAGIAGLAFARQLKKAKIPFTLIEKRSQLTAEGTGIALPANAMRALRFLGLASAIERHAHPVDTIIYTDAAGATLSKASLLEAPLNTDQFVALHRHQLHEILYEGLNEPIHFNTTIKHISQTQNGVLVTFNEPTLKQTAFSAVIGADGVHSTVRQLAFTQQPLADLGVSIWRWISPYPTHDLQPTYLLGGQDVFMAYPMSKDTVYCYAHALDPDNLHTQASDHQSTLTQQFGHYGSIAKTLLGRLPKNSEIIPGRLRSVAQPVFTSGRAALIGDASHACSPMLQQGAACALEDAIILSTLLQHCSIEKAFSQYAQLRSEPINWITTASDGPMKLLINLDQQKLPALYQKIRENGPLNVQGWRQLLARNPLQELSAHMTRKKEQPIF